MAQNPRLEDLRKRLAREPESPLFAQYAEELRRAGELAEAIRVCRDGLARRPSYATVRVTLGRALAESGDLAAARREFEAVLQSVPDNVSARRGLDELGPVGSAYQGGAAGPAVGSANAGASDGAGVASAAGAPPATGEPEQPSATAVSVVAATQAAVEGAPAGGEQAASQTADDEEYELEALRPPPVAGPPQLTFRPLVDVEDESRGFGQDVPTVVPEARPAPAAVPPVARGVPSAPAEPVEPKAAGDELASPTLADLYLQQGSTDKAAEMYAELVARDPTNAQLSSRLSEVRARLRAEAEQETGGAGHEGRALRRAIARLEALRVAFRQGPGAGRARGAAS